MIFLIIAPKTELTRYTQRNRNAVLQNAENALHLVIFLIHNS